jgi:SAM-dependent methyltransferase
MTDVAHATPAARMFSDRVASLLVCPISKAPLKARDGGWLSDNGLFYARGDFRIGLASETWARHQQTYENWLFTYLRQMESNRDLLEEERHATDDIYARIELTGDVLDVGGGLGTVTHHAGVEPNRYLVCDPLFVDAPALARSYPHYFGVYPLCEEVERVQAVAEFLPIAAESFDTVHMRSCLDHMANPVLALLEAHRVLRPGGKLVVGLSLESAHPRVARTTAQRIRWWIKDHAALFRVASLFHADPHVFHPRAAQDITSLIEAGGFDVAQVVEQSSYTGVLYVEAHRRMRTEVSPSSWTATAAREPHDAPELRS